MDGRAIGDAMARAAIVLVVVAFGIGGLAVWGLPKLWDIMKPWIHSITA